MKRLLLLALLLSALAGQVVASVITTNFTGSFANGGSVPDNDLSGWSDTRTLSGYTGLTVADVSVTLNITGGWNGDLYGYLQHQADNGTVLVVLLNRVGTGSYTYGYGEAGFSGVTLIDSNPSYTTSIQNYGGSQYAASALSGGSYNSAAGTLDTAYDGLTVNGTWTLFLADYNTGDLSQVTSWSLSIEAVPEPTTWAMIIFGAVLGGWHYVRRNKTA